jgi:hypothetical protein
VGNQDNREQEGHLGQPGSDTEKPSGTSGRTGKTGTESWRQGDNDTSRRPNRQDDDEDSGLGNRTGLR